MRSLHCRTEYLKWSLRFRTEYLMRSLHCKTVFPNSTLLWSGSEQEELYSSHTASCHGRGSGVPYFGQVPNMRSSIPHERRRATVGAAQYLERVLYLIFLTRGGLCLTPGVCHARGRTVPCCSEVLNRRISIPHTRRHATVEGVEYLILVGFLT